MMRALRLIGWAMVGLTLVVAVPASAANSASFTDATEGSVSDVTTVRVTNDDAGGVDFEVTVLGKPRLSQGDLIGVFVDTDGNAATGNAQIHGSEVWLQAFGSAARPRYAFCTWTNNDWRCADFGEWTDTQVTATSHVLRLGLTLGTKRSGRLNFSVGSLYTDPATNMSAVDRAPDTGVWTFNVVIADADGDGITGSADKCPRTKGGRYDSNRNGCPGPYPVINPDPKTLGVASGGSTLFKSVVFLRVPPGARVVITGPLNETLRASPSGRAPSKAMRRKLRDGTIITVRITKPGYVGYHGQFEVGPPSGLNLVKRRCIPATGRQTPVRCSRALRGS